MYPYHARIKQRIKNGELIGYEMRANYPNIGECLVLQFNCPPFERPIRPHRYQEYIDILIRWTNGEFLEKQEELNSPCRVSMRNPKRRRKNHEDFYLL